jgi:two-component system, NtrC family, sensor kinase
MGEIPDAFRSSRLCSHSHSGARFALHSRVYGIVGIRASPQHIAVAHVRVPSDQKRMIKSPRSIIVWMVLTIVSIGAFAYWDDQRESKAALEDFAHEQVTLARSAGHTLEAAGTPSALRSSEEPSSVIVLVTASNVLRTIDGTVVASPPIERAIANGDASVRLSRPEAAALGLPARTALAGISTTNTPTHDAVVVVATALRERDREVRAQWRLALSFIVSSAMVLAFGTFALRKQRKELELARELAVAEAVRERDVRLVRADKLATLGALGIGIAHEVSTPLGVIVGRAEQLATKVGSDERSLRAVEAIAEQADRIGKIVRALLNLARGGQATLENVSPTSIAFDAVELVQHRFEQEGVTLDERISPDLPSIACDSKLFTQVIVNLLLNACDACRAGGTVELGLTVEAERVVFVVLDDGDGISEEDAVRATEPFFTTKPPGEGTGLGLAIANEIVGHHHGTLHLATRSDGKRGTEARVEIAAVSAEKKDAPHG